MEDFLKRIEESQEDMLEVLKDFTAIPSVVAEEEGNMPFGINVQKALDFCLDMGSAHGFTVKNVDNYGGHIELPGKSDEIIAVVGHVDVVPAGEASNWKGDPFILEEREGKLYGRGALDDKGPLLSSYFALKALKDTGFNPSKTIRIILGCDEETAWKGMEYYMEKEKPNVVGGFSPDADFPAIHGEKGVIIFHFARKIKNQFSPGVHLVSFTGGTVANAVADKAVAVVSDQETFDETKSEIEGFIKSHNYEIILEQGSNDMELKITAKGISAHGSLPELGLNAISIMYELLGQLNFDKDDVNSAIGFYNTYIGYHLHGEKIGCHLKDKPSGDLAFNVGLVNINDHEEKITVNVRYPVTFDVEDVYSGIEMVVVPLGYRVKALDYLAPLYKPVDDPMVVTLMDAYAKFTGDTESKPIVIGGATYARAVPNTVAFGPVMPDGEDMCHQPNEYISKDDLFTSTKIFAKVLYELAK